jgi:hypothetical protein
MRLQLRHVQWSRSLPQHGKRLQRQITFSRNAMRFLLSKFDYDDKDHELVGQPDPLIVGCALAD